MRNLFKPVMVRRRLTDLDVEELRTRGIEALIIDLDNTLLPWDSDTPGPETLDWLRRARASGMRLCILTNNKKNRTQSISQTLGIRGIWSATKPFPYGFSRALSHLQVPRSRCAVVGDQLFTDILGGNAAGFATILVDPLSVREMAWTRFVRGIERTLLRRRIAYREEGRWSK